MVVWLRLCSNFFLLFGSFFCLVEVPIVIMAEVFRLCSTLLMLHIEGARAIMNLYLSYIEIMDTSYPKPMLFVVQVQVLI